MTIRRYDTVVVGSDMDDHWEAKLVESPTGDVVRWTDHNAIMTVMINKLTTLATDADELELKYRKQLWLSHGHKGLYGDDGEMQCSECIVYGAMDYKRDPLDKIEAAHHNACMLRVARIIIEKSQEETEEQGG